MGGLGVESQEIPHRGDGERDSGGYNEALRCQGTDEFASVPHSNEGHTEMADCRRGYHHRDEQASRGSQSIESTGDGGQVHRNVDAHEKGRADEIPSAVFRRCVHGGYCSRDVRFALHLSVSCQPYILATA